MAKQDSGPARGEIAVSYFDLRGDGPHHGDHYVAKGPDVYLDFTGDLIYRFSISESTIGKKGAAAIAQELCDLLNERPRKARP